MRTFNGWSNIAAGCALALASLHATAQKTPRTFIVAGYVFTQNRPLAPDQVDARALTRINYAFAVIRDGRMVEGSPVDAGNLAVLTGLRTQNPSLQVLISVGGWLGSDAFSDVALTAESRAKFVASAVDFLRRYNLDGLDVDWEYPGMAGAGHVFRPEDKQNFTLLLRDLRARFDREEKSFPRKLLLTIAAGASGDYLAHTAMDEAQGYVDTVNLMSYDFAMPSAGARTDHNAPLYADPDAPGPLSVDASVRALVRAGVPSRKILLGVPFYGQLWGRVANQNHGLFQAGNPVPGVLASFDAIQQTMLGHGFARYWDQAAGVPYLYNPATQEFVSYDDAQSIGLKCAYVQAQRLGGVMFWQSLDDSSGKLVEAINGALSRRP